MADTMPVCLNALFLLNWQDRPLIVTHSLREMLDVFANLFITEVDSQIDRKIEERLGASSSSDSE